MDPRPMFNNLAAQLTAIEAEHKGNEALLQEIREQCRIHTEDLALYIDTRFEELRADLASELNK